MENHLFQKSYFHSLCRQSHEPTECEKAKFQRPFDRNCIVFIGMFSDTKAQLLKSQNTEKQFC